MRDNDAYFSKTVRQGKTIVGVVHMPAWEAALSQELIWAVQTFIESRVEASKR
jgi:mono/diheme cytochrome c family protein